MTFHGNANNWEPPDGLGYSSLRPVRLTGQGIALAVIGVLFLIGAPVLAWLVGRQTNERAEVRRLLSEQGAQATAIITRVWRTGGKDSRHMVSYRFAGGAADEIEGRSSTPAAIWKGLAPGGSLPVRYVPGR